MTIPKPVVRVVLARDGGRCVLRLPGCLGVATVADHRANRGAGGSKVLNDPACLVAACELCNGAKEDAHGPYLARLREYGLRVLKAATNAATVTRCRDTPVTYPDGTVWKLNSDGSREQQFQDPPF